MRAHPIAARGSLAALLAAAACTSPPTAPVDAGGADSAGPADAPIADVAADDVAADDVAPTDAPAPTDDGGGCTNTPAGADLELINTAPAMNGKPAVAAYHVVYSSTGGLRVHGQICVPMMPGQHPILVYNHGGFSGLGAAEWGAVSSGAGNTCYNGAANGLVVIEAEYRGESDSAPAPVGSIHSAGSIEVCAGEVDDVLALLDVARARCDVDPSRVVVYGGSHGGCITLELLRRHAPGVRAGAALVPPTDFAPLYAYHVAHAPGGDAGADGCDPTSVHQLLVDVMRSGIGTPAMNPAGYASRSVTTTAADFGSIPFMAIWGTADCLVPLPQACAFHAALATAGVRTTNWHLDAMGHATTAAVPGCDGETFESGAWPGASGFTGDRYLVVLDGQGHLFSGVDGTLAVQAALGFLAAHL